MKKRLKILCNYNLTAKYEQKPTSEQIKLIQTTLNSPAEIEVELLANSLVNGCNCRPGATNGINDKSFISQQLFMLDFDNTDRQKKPFPPYKQIKPEEAIKKAQENGLYPCFAYYTHSNTEETPKFRVAFLMNRPVKDINERENVFNVFFDCFGCYIDKSCKNPSRIFYGTNTKTLIYADFKAVNSIKTVLSKKKTPYNAKKSVNKYNGTQKTTEKAIQTHFQSKNNAKNNVEAIKKRDIEYLKANIGNKNKLVFDTRKEFFDYLYKEIDLAELLEVEARKNFCCIIPGHVDNKPSANVFKEKFGIWKYKCFGCDSTLNTKQIIELLGGFDSEYKALEFIKAIYNLEIKQTEWAIEQRENIDRINESLVSSDEGSFSAICPIANSNTRNAQKIFGDILTIAKNTIYPERTADNENIIFYMSIRQLAKASGKQSIDKVSKYLKMLIYHKMIEIVPDEKVPQPFLSKALKQRENEKYKHTNFYSIPSWVYKHMQTIEKRGKDWKSNNYRMNGISYEMFYRTEGEQIAAELYPQYAKIHTTNGKVLQRSTTKQSDKLHDEIQLIITELIRNNGYCTESEVIEMAGRNKKTTDIQIKRSLTDIMNANNFVKSRANKELKAKFGIKADRYSHPMIIYPE